MIYATPTLMFPMLLYFILVFLVKGSGVDTTAFLDTVLFQFTLKSGAIFKFTYTSLIMLLTLLMLFIEVIKATTMRKLSLLDHGLSTVLFVICLVSFILIPEAGTGVFFVLMVATLVDVMAGGIVSMRMARRDLAIGPGVLPS